MHELINTVSGPMTRRRLLAIGGLAATGAAALTVGLRPSAAAAGSKESQKLARYQDTPRGKADCANCVQYRGPASCVLVDGTISPEGWCLLYAPKG